MRILLVDDEKHIVMVLKEYLQKEGYTVTTAHNGVVALELFKQNSYDLIVLDLMLPGLSGEEICKEIRKRSAVPIIMLTAKVDEDERLEGFTLGADDYISKPFSPREVVARIKAVLRRAGSEVASLADVITYDNGLTIDNTRHEVRINNEGVPLTATEFKILGAMARNPGRVYSRSQLVNLVQGYDFSGDDRVIDAHIKKIRQKIERNSSDPKIVVTVYGVGYKFNQEAET
ncbi:response regulator transcription factor [Desulfitobacterium sp.]|uniref:response regulator transcription factor n=1 Tax=Desulfitobacterium sp. TaxID=49981 RepID=UPI002B1F6847|nr:response regulator transcription factor [Desulfitobacterium sp.]MEA4902264.1 response regulator transcription factor [Desulfitobacterium sp.]